MTPKYILKALRRYQATALKRSRTNKFEHKRNQAIGEAKAYETAAEWLELLIQETVK